MSLTFVAVADCVEVNVVLLVGEEQQTEPRVEGVDGHDEEDAHDVPLLIRSVIITQVHVDLRHTHTHTDQLLSVITYSLSCLFIFCCLLFFSKCMLYYIYNNHGNTLHM